MQNFNPMDNICCNVNYLEATDISELKEIIENEDNDAIRLKLLAVWHKKTGKSESEIGDILQISKSAVHSSIKNFKEGGVKRLKEKTKRGFYKNAQPVTNEMLAAHLTNENEFELSVLFDFLFKEHSFKEHSYGDQICMAQAAREFEISDSVLKNAIKHGLLSAEIKARGKIFQTLLSREEIREKLPMLKGGSVLLRMLNLKDEHKAQPTYREPKPNYTDYYNKEAQRALRLEKVKQPMPVEPVRQIVRIEGSPWTTSPCINCNCNNPETCGRLTDWVMRS